MPLSEHEQRLLEQMERALYAEDPHLATTLRGSGGRFGGRTALVGGVLGVLVGVSLVLAGVATQIPALGVVGFVAMLASAWVIVRGVTAPPAQTGTTGASQTGKAKRGGIMARAEERFQRRREQDGRGSQEGR
jgi:hypothetical protein